MLHDILLPIRRRLFLSAVALSLGWGATPASAQADDIGAKASIELLVPRNAVKPGETFPVGVKFTMQPGWHIYWKNPGDSGAAPRFNWGMPGGGVSRMMRGSEWKGTEPQFPVPTGWKDAAGMVAYGYEGTVVFPAEVTVPPSVTPGQHVELTISADYMICKEVCIQETAHSTVRLRVGMESADDEGEEGGDARDIKAAQQQIDQARQHLPQPADGAKVQPGENGQVTVSVTVGPGAKNVQFFPNTPDGLVVEDVKVTTQGTTATASFRVRALQGSTPQATEFEGVFGWDANGGRRGVSAKVPVPGAGGE